MYTIVNFGANMTHRHTCIHCGKRKLEKYMKREEQYGSLGNYRWKCVICGYNFTYQIQTFFDYMESEAGEGIIAIPIMPMKFISGTLLIYDLDGGACVMDDSLLTPSVVSVLVHHIFLGKRLCPT